MSFPVIPFLKGSDSPSFDGGDPDVVLFRRNSIPALDLLNPRTTLNPKVAVDLSDSDNHKGHKYVKQLNPTLVSVRPLLTRMKEPSVLLLRGCDLLLLTDFPFDKFKSITALEISACRHLTSLPENTISQMTRLQTLDLSYLQITQLPDDLFNNAANLRSLNLKGCTNLHFLPEPSQRLPMLECLDLSHLPIESIPARFISPAIYSIILTGCYELQSLPSTKGFLKNLYSLDLSHCTSLQTARPIADRVQMLDLSNTACRWGDVSQFLTHLFFRNAKLSHPVKWKVIDRALFLRVCDLSGAQNLEDIDLLKDCLGLEALDVSKTDVQSIGFLHLLKKLRILVLKECTRLKELTTMERLEYLEVLDLSGCKSLDHLPEGLSNKRKLKVLDLCGCTGLTELEEGLFDQMSNLEELNLSKTDFKNLPSLANLIKLGTVIHFSDTSVGSTVPDLSDSVGTQVHPGEIYNCSEFHLVSTFISNSIFDQFRYKFTSLNNYISQLEDNHKPTPSTDKSVSVSMKRNCETIRADLKYILDKVDLLESSQNAVSSKELLHELLKFNIYNPDDPSVILAKLLRAVVKLKILVPPPLTPPPPPPPAKKVKYQQEGPSSPGIDDYERENYADDLLVEILREQLEGPYSSLTNIQRNCLLYFASLPVPIRLDKPIKESILIHLWYGEGFFDPLLYANQNSATVTSTENVVSISNGTGISSTIKKIGQETLQTLRVEGFIQIWNGKKWYIMEDSTHSLAITHAMEEHLFDFNECANLTSQFAVSGRACLLKSRFVRPSSSQTWLDYTKSPEKLASFNTVRTLLHIDEPVVNIKTEWFSAMHSLSVLQLVNLWGEPANIVDLNFLQDLKNMKQLRLLNLESFSAIQKLPDSICQLINLTILNLKYCSNLKELPAGIASLHNLIILDLSQCHLLPELPPGLALLSKLEVLKGFPITYEVGGQQSRKACTLRDLLKLDALRKLNIVVNKDSFPGTADLQVLSKMKNLCNLKITWSKNLDQEQQQELRNARQSRWKQLKCWEPNNETEEEEEPLRSNCLGNLKKLVLCCFPSETPPNWLHPSELQNLEKLYIVGGNLKTLLQDDINQATWKVKTLRFRYLSNLDMDSQLLADIFPDVTC